MEARNRVLRINTGNRNGVRREENGEPLSPAAKLFHQPQLNCYIMAILGSGKTIDVDVIKVGIETTLLHHPRFSSIMVSDKTGGKHFTWIPTKVVVADHIVIPTLNIPPESTTTTSVVQDQLLEDYVSSLSTTGLPLSRPLWDVHIINMRTSKAEAVGILRMHHSLGDGVSLISLLLACMRKSSDPYSLPCLPQSRTTSKPPQFSVWRSGLWSLLICVWTSLVLAWNTLVDVAIFVATYVFLKDSQTPIRGVKGFELRPRRVVHRMVSLDDIKVIKDDFGCTVNDVLLGITSFGLSRYLNRRYDGTDNGEKEVKNVLTNIRLRTTLIVNVRPVPGIHEMAEMMKGNSSAKWGNHIGYIILPIPLMMCEDPLDYVRKGMQISERKKKSLEAFFAYLTICLSIKFLKLKAAAAFCHRVLHHMTFTFSNVAGPVEEVEFFGHPLVYLAPTIYGYPQALTLHFQSYMNKMEIVLSVDELTVPDPRQLLDDIAESLKLIKQAVVAKTS